MKRSELQLREVDTTSLGELAYLYAVLARRLTEPNTNISHQKLPDWEDHLEFVKKRPYRAHYIIYESRWPIGAAYVSQEYELGIWVSPEHRGEGIASWTLKEIMSRNPAARWFANVNPRNNNSRKLFERNGFELAKEQPEPGQVTYIKVANAELSCR